MAVSAPTRHRYRLRGRVVLIAFTFLLPFLVLFIVFRIGPVGAALALSFTSYDVLSSPKWVGLSNYINILFGT